MSEKIELNKNKIKLENEGTSKEDFDILMLKLNKPIGELKQIEENKFESKNENLNLEVSYGKGPEDLFFHDTEEISKFSKEKQHLLEVMRLEPQKYKTLENFVLKNKNSEINFKKIIYNNSEFFAKVPPEPAKSNGEGGGNYEHETNSVVFRGDLSTPIGIIIALHEIGHSNDELSKVKLKEFPTSTRSLDDHKYLTKEQIDIYFRSERNAWAFAIKQIKPFIKDLGLTLDDLKTISHKWALKNHSDFAEEMLNGEPYL
ncbi:MAG: hypothetical protein WDK96_02035 [Candidatus Paceibacterota bacterium]|jgi:hypothetical protein